MITPRCAGGLAVMNDNFALNLGGTNFVSFFQPAYGLNLSLKSPSWIPTYNMLVKRQNVGVCVINNYIYAVSYIEL